MPLNSIYVQRGSISVSNMRETLALQSPAPVGFLSVASYFLNFKICKQEKTLSLVKLSLKPVCFTGKLITGIDGSSVIASA